MSLTLEGPPGDSLSGPEEVGSDSVPVPRIEYGPLLYAVMREGDSARAVPIAELTEGELHPLPPGEGGERLARQVLQERLASHRRLILFQGGVRVGSFFPWAPGDVSSEFCSPRALAWGHLEVAPSASGASRFLALDDTVQENLPRGSGRVSEPARTHRNAAQNLAGQALNELRAQWPPTLQTIRQDLQLVPLSDTGGSAVSATFLFRDEMSVTPAPDDAYALLVLGEPRGLRFERTYTWYRRVGEEGKGAPRFFSLLDWDSDGVGEIVLEVLGAESRWWAFLEREQGIWSLLFQDPCGTPEAQTRPQGGP